MPDSRLSSYGIIESYYLLGLYESNTIVRAIDENKKLPYYLHDNKLTIVIRLRIFMRL